MNSYHVSDFVIRLKNASLANRKTVVFPYTRINKEISNILVKHNFLENIKEDKKDDKKILSAKIAYNQRKPVFTDVLIISKPSLRVYSKKSMLLRAIRVGMGISVLSTSKGLMTEEEAAKQGIGGELLFRIW